MGLAQATPPLFKPSPKLCTQPRAQRESHLDRIVHPLACFAWTLAILPIFPCSAPHPLCLRRPSVYFPRHSCNRHYDSLVPANLFSRSFNFILPLSGYTPHLQLTCTEKTLTNTTIPNLDPLETRVGVPGKGTVRQGKALVKIYSITLDQEDRRSQKPHRNRSQHTARFFEGILLLLLMVLA